MLFQAVSSCLPEIVRPQCEAAWLITFDSYLSKSVSSCLPEIVRPQCEAA